MLLEAVDDCLDVGKVRYRCDIEAASGDLSVTKSLNILLQRNDLACLLLREMFRVSDLGFRV